MATVVTVHGTFAHVGSTPSAGPEAAPGQQWWQPGSRLEQDLKSLLAAKDGKLTIRAFEWSGENSELARRNAGRELLDYLADLEASKEPYCLVGHSHGGSVISAALLESIARRRPLDNLKRWITIGTPFVSMEREALLFTRLNLVQKVAFVASMMLFLMFAIYMVAGFIRGGETAVIGRAAPEILLVTGFMMSLPILVFYVILKVFDARSLLHYRRRLKARAEAAYGGKWLSLTHADDEAVQGLAFLPTARLTFFEKDFAVPALTMLSVIALPLLYIMLLASPGAMITFADFLKTRVYDQHTNPEVDRAFEDLRKRLAVAQAKANSEQNRTNESAEQRRAVWREYREARRRMQETVPNFTAAERSRRFRLRFFERDGRPCPNGILCGGGRDLRINSALLLHVATDELSWILGAEEASEWSRRSIWTLILPALLVPLISGLIALVLMLIIRFVAKAVSHALSIVLNRLTNDQVKQSAFGNDTDGEIAVGAVDRPAWLSRSQPRLPAAVADKVAAYSNAMAVQSIAKFRRAIGQLANIEPQHSAESAITTYFTWKELVHASYFDVPEFRKLVARAVSRADGFEPAPAFRAEPDFAHTGQWLAEVEGAPAPKPAGSEPPRAKDAGAVSAVVASTVKAEP